MAGRIRSIKPEILDDEEAAGLSDAAWRLWVSLWVLADDYGNARGGSRYLAASVWQDSRLAAKVPALLDELEKARRIVRYEAGGQPYAHIRNWEKHQRIDNAGRPKVPALNDVNTLPFDSPRAAANVGEPPQGSASRGLEGEGSPLFLRKGKEGMGGDGSRQAARGARLDPTWEPPPWLAHELANKLGVSPVELARELDKFRDYWIAVPGARGVKLDWDRTFRSWVRRETEAGKIGGHFPKKPEPDPEPEAVQPWLIGGPK